MYNAETISTKPTINKNVGFCICFLLGMSALYNLGNNIKFINAHGIMISKAFELNGKMILFFPFFIV